MSSDPAACPVTTGAEDLALVRRVLTGEREAAEKLGARVACLGRMLDELNRRRGGWLGEQDLEDLCQDVVIIVWRKLPEFQGSGELERWVYRIAQFELLNRLRIVRRRERRVMVTSELPDAPAAEDTTPANWAAVTYSELVARIQELPEEERRAVDLKHQEGMTFAKMAQLTGTSVNTLKARYYKALSRIRAQLEGEVGRE